MNRILEKKQLSETVFAMTVVSPLIARERKAGQFVVLMVDDESGERIPLTIADADEKRGTISLIFQAVGATTIKLSRKNVGETIPAVLGPLGKPTDIRGENGGEPGRVVCVGGGIGTAPLHSIAKALKAAGNRVTIIMGARSKDLFVLENEMREIADELILMTDDGSSGRKGLVTEPLEELCRSGEIDEVIAIGPPVMMKFCSLVTRPYGIKTVVSLNTVMIDGTGMCGGCRVSVGGETKFVCVDGPEFDGHLVDWDLMIRRAGAYRRQETAAREHACNLFKAIQK